MSMRCETVWVHCDSETSRLLRRRLTGTKSGVASTNACYGGTAALLNCVNWVEGNSWDGRYGLVICTAARTREAHWRSGSYCYVDRTNAPIVFESKLRGSHIAHVVDGKLSQTCYLMALDSCYKHLCNNFLLLVFCVTHFNSLVIGSKNLRAKSSPSMMRTTLFSILHTTNSIDEAAKEKFTPFSSLSLDESYQSRDLEKVSQHLAKSFYDAKVQPTTLVPKEVGNMYTASLYAAFASLIHNKHNDLAGNRVVMFSYGSGSTATMFSLRLCENQSLFSLSSIASVMDVGGKLKARHEVRSKGLCDEQRGGILDLLAPGTYYLKEVDSLYRRFYGKKGDDGSIANGH
ncbi:unnamed protein product [Arabis nemorensis]|uniref:Hydroxymethylglutaryl-coenzyme A synthase C-terminal domain-containing protein n=1 Tax=Arabis nemorensis TaxID=586526 RepID=A0A565ALD2_9BRAS|nr:unnamed protein product [Arabis nemorensis]